MAKVGRSWIAAYGFAAFSYGVSAVGTVVLWDSFFRYVPFALFFAALSITAWFGGLWPGLAVAFLGAITTGYLMSTAGNIVVAAPFFLFTIACFICYLIDDRSRSGIKLRSQLERVSLLDQITRAIGTRQDLKSILQVVIGRLEENLPVDLCCICLYDRVQNSLTVTSVGLQSGALATELALTQQSRIDIDENGLSRCVTGKLVYEPDVSSINYAFPRRLAKGGLRSMVAAPMQVESEVFGVLIAARRAPNAFSSADCEFLRQLTEHVALAAHQAQLYSSLQQAYEDLRTTQLAVTQQERLRALGQMASGIAHDINNALSPVALYTESLLENEPGLSTRAREFLEIIERSIDDVSHTVARMREFYRQREPQATLSPVYLNNLLQQAIDLTRARWNDMPQQRGIVIKAEVDVVPDVPMIMASESEIRDALVNLIFNAVDAMPEGGKLILRTRFRESDAGSDMPGMVHLEVTDTGVGMDEETRKRCLEPFFTTKGERGTGLGLAMVFGVIERHSGEIEIESQQGQGTTVRLSFPVATATTAPRQLVASGVRPTGMRVLVIDDDPLLIKSLREILENDGHIVTTASGGQAGIDAFRAARTPYSLVITDLGMPYVDGRKVAASIKASSPSMPVVLLTGWGARMVADGEKPPHVDHILSKPPKLRELRQTLARFGRNA
jgi:signal transduction histidine kinase